MNIKLPIFNSFYTFFKAALYLSFFTFGLSVQIFGQNDKNLNQLWSAEPFGKNDISKEIVDKRDAFSKHFDKGNGTISAHIASGPIHYQENGQWKTIFHSITPSSSGFENIHNSHKTYFPATSSGHIQTVLENGAVLKDMLNMKMYFEGNGQILQAQNIQSKSGAVNFNELTYAGVYGNGIDLRLTQHTSKRKMDYVIQSLSALGTIPNGATDLVFEETVQLPLGWTAELRDNVIYLLDVSGKVQAQYEKPVYSDTPIEKSKSEANDEKKIDEGSTLKSQSIGLYLISQNGNILTIQTKFQLLG